MGNVDGDGEGFASGDRVRVMVRPWVTCSGMIGLWLELVLALMLG